MALAGMLDVDESALICDLAETYHIYDYRKYDADYIATLATGLGPDDTTNLLLARIFDQLNLLIWMNTEDGQKNRNRPESLADMLTGKCENKNSIVAFDTVEQFEIERQKILKGVA